MATAVTSARVPEQAVLEASLTPVLCVDDDPQTLRTLKQNLRGRFRVVTALGASVALALLKAGDTRFAVIVSDLNMPIVGGADFLVEAKAVAPDTTRILLCEPRSLPAAIEAINAGSVFRCVTKPCVPEVLLEHVVAAAELHRQRLAEHALLEQTQRGALRALGSVLAMSNRLVFQRATRVRERVAELAQLLELDQPWRVETAAFFVHLGGVVLEPATLERLYEGQPLSAKEDEQVREFPQDADLVLGQIPQLEHVREIILGCNDPGQAREEVRAEAALLGAVLELERLEAGSSRKHALAELKKDPRWDPRHVESLLWLLCQHEHEPEEVRLWDLAVGMVFAEDVKTTDGTLLVAKGHEVTSSLLRRLQNRVGSVAEPMSVLRG